MLSLVKESQYDMMDGVAICPHCGTPLQIEHRGVMELGKVAVITGAASGIGAACAKAPNAGAKVAVVDIDAKGSQLIAESIEGIAVECDLADKAAIDSMIIEVEQQIGPIDLLFNNAESARVQCLRQPH